MSDEPGSRQRRQAVALAYGEDADAPRVVAQGYGALAELIIQEARRQGVYVHSSPELVNLLMQMNLDEQIPPRLYSAIAELLVWLGEMLPTNEMQEF